MQGLLAQNENRSPQSPIPRVGGAYFAGSTTAARGSHLGHMGGNGGANGLLGTSMKRKRTGAVLVVVAVCTLLLMYGALGGSGSGEGGGAGKGETITHPSSLTEVLPSSSSESGEVVVSSSPRGVRPMITGGGVGHVTAWGYNKDRNIPRWKAISKSIAADIHQGTFTVVDYGADQGYFSISTAATFPSAHVMGLEMGGVGGEIWKKKNSQDVLEIQEQKVRELGVEGRMMICQTMVKPDHFFALEAARSVSDYQFVLSVFHWFALGTRSDFEKAIAALLRNARTTFIELPTIGDNSKLIRQQVGWEYFVKWYDGRTDTGLILREAAEAHNINVKITEIASVPWVKWSRVVHRIDVLDAVSGGSFNCQERRKVYSCNPKRTHHQSCAGYDE